MRENRDSGKSWWSWPVAVGGWLACAAMCLWLTISLEEWPDAYEMMFMPVLVILFCNILVFLFVTTRLAAVPERLLRAVLLICLCEGCLLGGMYLLGRYGIGA